MKYLFAGAVVISSLVFMEGVAYAENVPPSREEAAKALGAKYSADYSSITDLSCAWRQRHWECNYRLAGQKQFMGFTFQNDQWLAIF